MSFRNTIAAALVLAFGCTSGPAEFSWEKRELSHLEQRVTHINESTPETEICDIADKFQEITAHAFLDHDWIPGNEDNHPIYSEDSEDVSAVYIPGKEFEGIQGMQCIRDESLGLSYGCSLASRLTYQTPDVGFHASLREGIFPPSLSTTYGQHSMPRNWLQIQLAYLFDRERNEYETVLSASINGLGDMIPAYTASCPDIDSEEVIQRIYSLAAFAEARISE